MIEVSTMREVTARALYSDGKDSTKRKVFRRASKTGRKGAEGSCWSRRQQPEMPDHRLWKGLSDVESEVMTWMTVDVYERILYYVTRTLP